MLLSQLTIHTRFLLLMIVNTPVSKRTVVDYDFTFLGGSVLQLTIDASEGDTISFDSGTIRVYIAPADNLMNPETKTPAERHTILQSHLIHYKEKERELTNLTPEEKYELSKTLLSLAQPVSV